MPMLAQYCSTTVARQHWTNIAPFLVNGGTQKILPGVFYSLNIEVRIIIKCDIDSSACPVCESAFVDCNYFVFAHLMNGWHILPRSNGL